MKKSEILEVLNQRLGGNNVVDYYIMDIEKADLSFLNVKVKRITWEELDALHDFILNIESDNYGCIEIGFNSDVEID